MVYANLSLRGAVDVAKTAQNGIGKNRASDDGNHKHGNNSGRARN
jgi:hypothetical protein